MIFRTVTILTLAFVGPALAAPPEEKPTKPRSRLGDKLIRQATGDTAEDVMDQILRLMNESSRMLSVDFEIGPPVATVQQDIMQALDDAIKKAAAARRPTRSKPQKNSDKRTMPKSVGKPTGGEDQAQEQGGSSPAGEQVAGTTPEQSVATNLRETRRSWGHLPAREREEIIQGIREQYLERYRDWIERYYRALQESDQ